MNINYENDILISGAHCKTKAITEHQCENIQPMGRAGPLVARIPVVISQSKIHINIESMVNLDYPAVAIRDRIRHVYLTQCNLLDIGDKRHGKIYLNGYIKESIEYAATKRIKDRNLQGIICYKNVKIPFECSAKIDYCGRPVFKSENRFITVNISDMEKAAEELYNTQANHRDMASMTGVCLERMFCELEDVNIIDSDDISENSMIDEQAQNQFLNSVTEYMVISITFSLLQWQMVSIPRFSTYNI